MNTDKTYEWKNTADRGQSLKKAHEIINNERQDKHGMPEDCFGTIARYWNAYINSMCGLEIDLQKENVCELMSLLKHARMVGQGYNPDNQRDAEGYLALADDFRSKKSEEQSEINFCMSSDESCGCSDRNRDYIAGISVNKHH